jgi:hypothetical protein
MAEASRPTSRCYDSSVVPRVTSPLRYAVLLALLLSLPACGVAFRDGFDGTELFKEVELSGDRIVNRPLTVTMELNEAYPVPVRVACYYDKSRGLSDDQKKIAFHERAVLIGQRDIGGTAGSRPDEEVTPTYISFQFSIPEPGQYFLACITPAAPDNGIGKRITIRSAADASAQARP